MTNNLTAEQRIQKALNVKAATVDGMRTWQAVAMEMVEILEGVNDE